MKQSLQGKKIVVTREASQAASFSLAIKEVGGIPVSVPLLKITCRDHFLPKDALLENEWIFFTSAHGVRCFMRSHSYAKQFSQMKIATVGHKTEAALKQYGLQATFIPSTYNAEVMAEEFFQKYPEANDILLVRGNISRPVLVEEFTKRKIRFKKLVVYDNQANMQMQQTLIDTLAKMEIDFLTFTSPSAVHTFVSLLDNQAILPTALQLVAVCIGTTTEKAAKAVGFRQTITPDTFTTEAMITKMIEFSQQDNAKI